MSADNYFIIRKDNFGKFAPVMGFDSDDYTPEINLRHHRFNTVEAARAAVENEYAEYGTYVHPECYEEGSPTLLKTDAGHYTKCSVLHPDFFYPEDAVCDCETIEANWNTEVPAQDAGDPPVADDSEYGWVNVFDAEDRETFLKEVAASAAFSVESVVATLTAWSETARALKDPVVREALLNSEPFKEEDFIKVERP